MEYDADKARLQVTEEAFETLTAVYRGGKKRSAPDTVDLYRIGVLTDRGVHARMRDSISAVVNRRATFNLWLSGPQTTDEQQGWALGGTAGWYKTTPTGIDFRTISTDGLSDLLADTVDLGPRDGLGRELRDVVGEAVVPLRRRVFDAILGGDATNRQSAATMIATRAPAALDAVATHLREGRWRAFHAQSLWFDQHRARHGAAVIAVDTPASFLIAHPTDPHSVDLIAVQPADIWRLLLRLNPPRDQITPSPDDPAN